VCNEWCSLFDVHILFSQDSLPSTTLILSPGAPLEPENFKLSYVCSGQKTVRWLSHAFRTLFGHLCLRKGWSSGGDDLLPNTLTLITLSIRWWSSRECLVGMTGNLIVPVKVYPCEPGRVSASQMGTSSCRQISCSTMTRQSPAGDGRRRCMNEVMSY